MKADKKKEQLEGFSIVDFFLFCGYFFFSLSVIIVTH